MDGFEGGGVWLLGGGQIEKQTGRQTDKILHKCHVKVKKRQVELTLGMKQIFRR